MSNINGNIETLFNKMETFVSSKTIIGEPIESNGVTIMPLVDIAFGVGVGGGSKDRDGNSGGGGLGAKISPCAVLVIQDQTVQMINVKSQDSLNKLIDMAPGIVSKLNFGPFKKDETVNTVKFEEKTVVEPLEPDA